MSPLVPAIAPISNCPIDAPCHSAMIFPLSRVSDTSDDIADIMTEISMLADLSSPWVTKYFESFVVDATLWIVMEYCSGGSCLDLLQDHHQGLEEGAVGVIMVQVLQALSYLHGLGKIHRDIKAANILLTEEGRALLADFGVSAQVGWDVMCDGAWAPCGVAVTAHFDAVACAIMISFTSLTLSHTHTHT